MQVPRRPIRLRRDFAFPAASRGRRSCWFLEHTLRSRSVSFLTVDSSLARTFFHCTFTEILGGSFTLHVKRLRLGRVRLPKVIPLENRELGLDLSACARPFAKAPTGNKHSPVFAARGGHSSSPACRSAPSGLLDSCLPSVRPRGRQLHRVAGPGGRGHSWAPPRQLRCLRWPLLRGASLPADQREGAGAAGLGRPSSVTPAA